MPSMADRIAEMNTIAGFLKPVYSEDPLPGREVTHALTPQDFEKVREGYACPRCLADFGGMYRATCPICLHERNLEADLAASRQDWQEHYDEAHSRVAGPATRRPRMDEAIDRIMRDPDVEHGTLSSLMPRKWGRS